MGPGADEKRVQVKAGENRPTGGEVLISEEKGVSYKESQGDEREFSIPYDEIELVSTDTVSGRNNFTRISLGFLLSGVFFLFLSYFYTINGVIIKKSVLYLLYAATALSPVVAAYMYQLNGGASEKLNIRTIDGEFSFYSIDGDTDLEKFSQHLVRQEANYKQQTQAQKDNPDQSRPVTGTRTNSPGGPGQNSRGTAQLERGDELVEQATNCRERGDYDRAIECLTAAEDAYTEAQTAGTERHSDQANQKLEKVSREMKTAQRDRVKKHIKSLRTDLQRTEELIDDAALDAARDNLDGTRNQSTRVLDEIREHGFDALEEELLEIRRTQENLEQLITELERKNELEADIAAIESGADEVERLRDEDSFREALQLASDLQARSATSQEAARECGLTETQEKLNTLEQRIQDLSQEISNKWKKKNVPDSTPKVPDASIEYSEIAEEEPIGFGGNADVTRAIISVNGEEVPIAVKKPRMSGTLHSEIVERMMEEAERWDKLDDHENIVDVIDYESSPLPWIAMEYMDAGHLGERSDQLEIPESLWVAVKISDAIHHAHRRGVAHLDLKPENVLFRTTEASWDSLKVADWGLSKHLLNHSKSMEGISPQYAAPEQFDGGFGQIDDITDIYQLGTVLYELFTGQPPFEGEPSRVMRAVINDQPAAPSEADVPDELDDVLLKALAKEKDARYSDILYLRDDLQEIHHGYYHDFSAG
jgi:sRNA-binding carbon storage regulator CsrA